MEIDETRMKLRFHKLHKPEPARLTRMLVAARCTTPVYNQEPPYHPSMAYAELPFSFVSATANPAYTLLRQLLVDLGLDSAHYGESNWNPLGQIVRPGNIVVLKPNFVISHNAGGSSLDALVTHPSILRALVDYAFVALKGEGKIIIADAPQMDCNWDILMRHERLDAIQEFYYREFGFPIDVCDLRNFEVIDNRQPAYPSNRRELPGDPLGSVVVNLGKESKFYGLPSHDYYGADYDRSVTNLHHQGETHEYCVSKTVLAADVVISVPKMKVHKKVGVTLNCKGLVGINTNKNYLVHYRLGTPSSGGDQLPDLQNATDSLIVKTQRWLMDRTLAKDSAVGELAYRTAHGLYQHVVRRFAPVSPETRIRDAGNWYGNDSAWRMTADLANIVRHCDRSGEMQSLPQRRFFSVIDGIVGGEDNGPLAATAKPVGCLVAGEDIFAVDMVATRLMGFDARVLKQFSGRPEEDRLEAVRAIVDGHVIDGDELFDPFDRDPRLDFKPHPGWAGQIEVARSHSTQPFLTETV
jgi:uncharacterized protein (DUF362 family)